MNSSSNAGVKVGNFVDGFFRPIGTGNGGGGGGFNGLSLPYACKGR
jgi:hypothetical protein